MDQPSPMDSITITMNAAPARSCGPIPFADRWRVLQLAVRAKQVSSSDYALGFT